MADLEYQLHKKNPLKVYIKTVGEKEYMPLENFKTLTVDEAGIDKSEYEGIQLSRLDLSIDLDLSEDKNK